MEGAKNSPYKRKSKPAEANAGERDSLKIPPTEVGVLEDEKDYFWRDRYRVEE